MSNVFNQSGPEPSFYPNPQNSLDAKILREVHSRYGLDYIDGTVVNFEDWEELNEPLFDADTFQSGLFSDALSSQNSKIEDQILYLYPNFAPVMGYETQEKQEAILSLELENGDAVIDADFDISEVLDGISDAEDEAKREIRQDVLEPILTDRRNIQNTIQFQLECGCDIISPPSVPITSLKNFSRRIQLAEDVFNTAEALRAGGLIPTESPMLPIVSLAPSVLRTPENASFTREDRMVEAFSDHNFDFDMVGIHLRNYNRDYTNRNQSLLNAIQRISSNGNSPIFLLNTDEFGLVSFNYGVGVVSSPVASFPYPRRSPEGSSTQLGQYYHYEDLIPYSRDYLMDEVRPEYEFECPCEICQRFERITRIEEDYWNEFRRIHYLLAKDSEINRIRGRDKLLKAKLHDMVSRSKRTDLVAYVS